MTFRSVLVAKSPGRILVTRAIITWRVLAAIVAVFVHAVPFAGASSQPASPPDIVTRMGKQVGCLVPTQALPGVTMWAEDHRARGVYVAWCERQRAEPDRRYDLVIAATKSGHPWAACPAHIRVGREEPTPQLEARLLPYELPYPMTLSEFWYPTGDDLIDPTPVKSTAVPGGPAIDFGFGDAGNLLLCFEKQWVMGGYH